MDLMFPMAADIAPAATPAEPARLERDGLENGRLRAIADALPDTNYAAVLALGAAPGLASRLARRCDDFEQISGPAIAGHWRGTPVDLIVVSDLLVGAPEHEMESLIVRMMTALNPGGHLVLAHWLDDRGADDAAALFVQTAGDRLLPISRQRTPHFRLDVLERA